MVGFYTEEVRVGGKRVGFDIVTLGSESRRGILARNNSTVKGPSVGQYTVHVDEFEAVALSVLQNCQAKVILIDEIGKMECFSRKFQTAIRKVFSEFPGTIVATIPISRGKPLPLVQEVSASKDSQIVTATRENRDELPAELANQIKN